MAQDIKIQVDKDAFEIKKSSTKKAVFVLRDLFGDGDVSVSGSNLPTSSKKKGITLFLTIFTAVFGFHRLYLGYINHFLLHISAVVFAFVSYQFLPDSGLALLDICCLILWEIADLLAILFGSIKDKQGKILIYW